MRHYKYKETTKAKAKQTRQALDLIPNRFLAMLRPFSVNNLLIYWFRISITCERGGLKKGFNTKESSLIFLQIFFASVFAKRFLLHLFCGKVYFTRFFYQKEPIRWISDIIRVEKDKTMFIPNIFLGWKRGKKTIFSLMKIIYRNALNIYGFLAC